MDERRLERLAALGVVMPLLTLGVVRWAALTWQLSTLVVVLVLFVLPMFVATVVGATDPRVADSVGDMLHSGPDRNTLAGRLPEQHQAAFAQETLDAPLDDEPPPDYSRRNALLLYLLTIPLWTLVVLVALS